MKISSGIGWLISCIFGASAADYMEFRYGESKSGHRMLFTHHTGPTSRSSGGILAY